MSKLCQIFCACYSDIMEQSEALEQQLTLINLLSLSVLKCFFFSFFAKFYFTFIHMAYGGMSSALLNRQDM